MRAGSNANLCCDRLDERRRPHLETTKTNEKKCVGRVKVSKTEATRDVEEWLFAGQRPHPIDRFVGERVKYYRKRKKLTQTELAAKLGLTFQQIQKYEKGSNRIGASRLYLLSKLLEVPVSKFFEGLELELGGTQNPGFAESERGTLPVQPLEDQERADLLNAFSRIPRSETRKHFIDLLKAIGDDTPVTQRRSSPTAGAK